MLIQYTFIILFLSTQLSLEMSINIKIEMVVFLGPTKEPCLKMEEVPNLPTITDGEILGKFLISTICGSDLHTIQGKRIEPCTKVIQTVLPLRGLPTV